MLRFLVFDEGRPATQWPVRNAYLIGSDHNAMRGTITFKDGEILCDKRESGVAALALQVHVGDCGELTLQTCLLPEREQPYLLSLEMARHRLMTVYNKFEDWGMFDMPADNPAVKRAERARKLFIEALCAQGELPKADRLAKESLAAAIDGSEELALAHAGLLLERRRTTGSLPRYVFGAGVPLEQNHPHLRAGLQSNFDFLLLPMPWKALAPQESGYKWEALDDWARWAQQQRIPVFAGPLISFDQASLPDWLFIWEHDYDTVRDMIYEHVERVVKRYKDVVGCWNVVSGLHLNNHFTFSFDQLMDLTRMTTMMVKKLDPTGRVMVELREPFGEYYSRNQRSIPPMMYADLLLQGGVQFDAFSIKLQMGQSLSGQYTRDLMQISNMLDQFAPLGKPMTLTLSAPSSMVTEEMIVPPDNAASVDPNCGYWRKPWSPVVQSHWIEAVLHIAISKPYMDSVIWADLVDHPAMELPLSGMVSEELQPKPALKRYSSFRRHLLTGSALAPEPAAQG